MGPPQAQPLPLDLLRFDAQAEGRQIGLNWTTANEENFSHFDLERSTDGRQFNKIARLNGKGEVHNDYGHLDRDVKPGVTYYYRLRMVDLDAAYEYSPVVQAAIDGKGLVIVGVNPNPTVDFINIQYDTEEESDVSIRLLDMNGRLLYFSDVVSAKGINNTILDMTKYAAGMYMLTIKHGGDQVNHKIVKH